jgi:hypothetical protein
MSDNNNGEDEIDKALDDVLIDKDDHCCPGTFWVIREPEHGEKLCGIKSIDANGVRDLSKCGEVYCLNCKKWNEHKDTSKAKSCPACNAPYAANWFPQLDYIVEVDGSPIDEPLPYKDALDKAKKLRSPSNVIIVSAYKPIN